MIWTAGLAFSLLALGVWIGATLGIAGIVIMMIWGGGVPLLGGGCWIALNIYALTALPMFLFMGQVILHSGLASRTYDAFSPLLARLPGKLLHTNIILCAMFAAVFGSSTACAATVGSVAIPELRKRNYNNRVTLGTICVAGTLGMMIPPSGQFIVYGSMTEVSVGALFAAGIIPGIMMVVLYMVYIGFSGAFTPQIAGLDEKLLPLKTGLAALLNLWPLILLIVACLGPIYAGIATPTESAGIGVLASVIVGFTVGKLTWKSLWDSVKESAEITSMLGFIILGAMILSTAVSTIGLPRQLVYWIGSIALAPAILLTGIYIMYLILGCFFDGISIMLMTLPFVYPLILSIGFDPLWFGVVVTLLIEIGMVTPPLGLNLFVVQGVAGSDTTISDVFLGSIPLLLLTLVVLAILTVFPEVVHYLPNLLRL